MNEITPESENLHQKYRKAVIGKNVMLGAGLISLMASVYLSAVGMYERVSENLTEEIVDTETGVDGAKDYEFSPADGYAVAGFLALGGFLASGLGIDYFELKRRRLEDHLEESEPPPEIRF